MVVSFSDVLFLIEENVLDGFVLQEEERLKFHMSLNSRARPACFSHELSLRNIQNMRRINDSVLGQVGIKHCCQ